MKRRKFLGTVGGAAGAAALGGCCSVPPTSKTNKNAKNVLQGPVTGHGPAGSCGLLPADPNPPAPPFRLHPRPVGWFPDGAHIGHGSCERLFHEEVVGRDQNKHPLAFGVDFGTLTSKQWILGWKLDLTRTDDLTKLTGELAIRVRRYNASLYRLRRLHFYHYYKVVAPTPPPAKWPDHNKHGDPPDPLPDPMTAHQQFGQLVKEAEDDWENVTGQLNDLLEGATDNGYLGIRLMAADMIAVNGYIVSMRVVVRGRNEHVPTSRQLGGSSSQVSLDSAFSSLKQ